LLIIVLAAKWLVCSHGGGAGWWWSEEVLSEEGQRRRDRGRGVVVGVGGAGNSDEVASMQLCALSYTAAPTLSRVLFTYS
jgi:hypothetical protein